MARISDIINKPIKSFANSGLMERVCKRYRANDGNYIAAFSIGAMILKDAYNCGIYVAKNERNKSIPDDKRRYISMFDVMNFLLITGVQILTYLTIAQKATQAKIFDKVLGKHFNPEKMSLLEQKLQKKFPDMTSGEITQNINKYKDTIALSFEHLFSLITTLILAKRVIVPLFATPLAEKAEKKFSANA
ncbi:hypothetical protein J6S88_05010 [bacterium]|nr:hypothetical protein [bacterium]